MRVLGEIRNCSISVVEGWVEQRLIDRWLAAANDLGIRVTAPIELFDAKGVRFVCEALLHDFGSASGAIIVSAKTERLARAHLRSLGDRTWVAIAEPRPKSSYCRDDAIEELLDFGWFGETGNEPDWYVRRDG